MFWPAKLIIAMKNKLRTELFANMVSDLTPAERRNVAEDLIQTGRDMLLEIELEEYSESVKVVIPDAVMQQGDTLRLPIKHPLAFKITEPELFALRTISKWLARVTGNVPACPNAIASCVMVAALAHPKEILGWIRAAQDYSKLEGLPVADVCAAKVEACPEYRSKKMPT